SSGVELDAGKPVAETVVPEAAPRRVVPGQSVTRPDPERPVIVLEERGDVLVDQTVVRGDPRHAPSARGAGPGGALGGGLDPRKASPIGADPDRSFPALQ